ncbi:hypothetical protein COOONC_08913 [Cooperia oncophora]
MRDGKMGKGDRSVNDTTATPFHVWLLHQLGVRAIEPEFVFGLERANGGHSAGHLQAILGDDNGRLQVSIAKTSLEGTSKQILFKKREHFYGGLTLKCAQIVDNEVRSLDFIYNIDYLMNSDDEDFFLYHLGYEQYEKYQAASSALPYNYQALNMKVHS